MSVSRLVVVCSLLVFTACSDPIGNPDSGQPGSAGATGAAGAAGATGAAGTVGTAGTTGAAGVTGAAGTNTGAAGVGTAGTTGSAGAAGTTGGAGASGGRGGAAGAGASGGRGGAAGRGGGSGATGVAGRGGSGGATGVAGRGGSGAGGAVGNFSFFVTSLSAMRALSGNQNGFGGDLTFGETGAGAGLRGADKICTTIAEMSMPGSGAKGWRAFLSSTTGPVHAIDRVGNGPWYDRMGRVVAMNRAGLMANRPTGGDAVVASDLPNENGIPNHSDGAPGCTGNSCPDNHDTLTGSNATGMLLNTTPGTTCNDWTSAVGSAGRPGLGHSWPASSGTSWLQVHSAAGCAPSVAIVQAGGPPAGATGVGDGGGYGGIYCFALAP